MWLSGVWLSVGVRNLLISRSLRRESLRHGWRWGGCGLAGRGHGWLPVGNCLWAGGEAAAGLLGVDLMPTARRRETHWTVRPCGPAVALLFPVHAKACPALP